MTQNNSLDSVVFLTLPENFKVSKDALHIDPTIPLPVQLPPGVSKDEKFDISAISEEMILAGILAILAYDKTNQNINY